MRRTLLLQAAFLVLFMVCLFGSAYASYSTSIIYTRFNTTSWHTEALDENYTSIGIDIKCYLTFNSTGTPAAKVAFMNETVYVKGIIILFYKDNTEKVYLADDVNEIQIATGTWTKGNITRVVLGSQKITITDHYGDASEAEILSGFSFDKAFANVRVKGATAYTATDGYMQVDVGGGVGDIGGAVMDWIPSIISLMMLSMVVGILKTFSK
jgi:hypothetical protein